MKISIITVSYNSSETIGDTCRSISEQSFADWEHWIIDGGSTDETLEVLASYADSRRGIISEPDGGIYDAMNKGIRFASGNVVGFLNADDFYESCDVLESISAELSDQSISLVYGNLRYVDALETDSTVRNWRSGAHRFGMFHRGWMPPHPTVYVRKDAFEEVGPFDLSFPICADWEWLYRAFEIHGLPSCFLDQYLVRMRVGGVSNRSFGNVLRSNLQAVDAFSKHGKKLPVLFFPGKLIHRGLQFVRK